MASEKTIPSVENTASERVLTMKYKYLSTHFKIGGGLKEKLIWGSMRLLHKRLRELSGCGPLCWCQDRVQIYLIICFLFVLLFNSPLFLMEWFLGLWSASFSYRATRLFHQKYLCHSRLLSIKTSITFKFHIFYEIKSILSAPVSFRCSLVF